MLLQRDGKNEKFYLNTDGFRMPGILRHIGAYEDNIKVYFSTNFIL
jgi:hypothetical protein